MIKDTEGPGKPRRVGAKIIAVGYRVNSYQATQFRIWAYTLRDGVPYKELGSEHFTRRNKERVAKRLKKRLEDLGFAVELRPATADVSN